MQKESIETWPDNKYNKHLIPVVISYHFGLVHTQGTLCNRPKKPEEQKFSDSDPEGVCSNGPLSISFISLHASSPCNLMKCE